MTPELIHMCKNIVILLSCVKKEIKNKSKKKKIIKKITIKKTQKKTHTHTQKTVVVATEAT